MDSRLKNMLRISGALVIVIMLCTIFYCNHMFAIPIHTEAANTQVVAEPKRIEVIRPADEVENESVMASLITEESDITHPEEVIEPEPEPEPEPASASVVQDATVEQVAQPEVVVVEEPPEPVQAEPIVHTEDDLHLLAKVIWFEAGSSWLPEEWKLCVGEVVLNRVASPEFPNTISEVVYQPGQYACVWRSDWNSKTFAEDDECLLLAQRLLDGERLMEPSVVFQSGETQGSGVYTSFYDSCYGTTYFCHSSYMDNYQ